MKYRFLYFALSLLVIVPGSYSLARYGLRLAIDFTGGSVLQLASQPSNPDLLITQFKSHRSINSAKINPDQSVTFSLPPITQTEVTDIVGKLQSQFSTISISTFSTIGPSVGQDMITKTIWGVILATAIILLFVARAFNSYRFGICAVLAMFHDTLILIGSFSLLGHFAGVQADLLFVTAVLTILSFSVHDTIVVYDRIRELKRKHSHLPLSQIANKAVSETLIRSLNNSLTIIFMLLALVLLGGETIRWFAVALLIGTITGTYSSTFTATPLLVVIDDWLSKRKHQI